MNPLELIHDAIWELLEDSSDFTGMVSVGCRIKYTDQHASPEPVTRGLTADFPEVRVFQIGLLPDSFSDSTGSGLVVRFAIQVATGGLSQYWLQKLQWAVLRAMTRWAATLEALEWQSKAFVRALRAVEVRNSQGDERGVKQWQSLWACDVQCWFDTSDLEGTAGT